LLPSRYCPSDTMEKRALQTVGKATPGYDQVDAIRGWIRENIEYKYGVSTGSTTAIDTLRDGAGVCRDFSHIGISLCRALRIPARMVVGYVWFAEPPQDFHALIEAWLDGQWMLFDPTGMAPVDRVVRIGTGRDAKDVAFATIFGALQMTRKEVMVLEHDPRPHDAPAPEPALNRSEPAQVPA